MYIIVVLYHQGFKIKPRPGIFRTDDILCFHCVTHMGLQTLFQVYNVAQMK